MDFLRRAWLQIQVRAGEVSREHKIILGLVVFLAVTLLILFSLYFGRAEMVPITQFTTAEDREQLFLRLKNAGVNVKTDGRQILVPSEDYAVAIQVITTSDMLASDTSAAFDELVANQSPWISNKQRETTILWAKQKMLAEVISKWKNVRKADVMISMPEDKSFGRTFVKPSASVNVVMRGSARINQKMVTAFSSMVAGAVAEMSPEDVTVVDANNGRSYTVKSNDEQLADDALARKEYLEKQYHHKISEMMLNFIPGAYVAVNVQVDPVVFKRGQTTEYDREQLANREERRVDKSDTKSAAAEPGARSNTMADIQTANAGARTTTESEEEIVSYGIKPIVRQETYEQVGQNATKVNVTINVPHTYFRGVYLAGQPAGAEDPDEATLSALVATEKEEIRKMVEPLIETRDPTGNEVEGVVTVARVIDASELLALIDGAPPKTSMISILESGWIRPVGLGLLAFTSIGIMFGMVKRASQRPPIPSIEELAGVPPELAMDEDMIGEAAESEAEMGGLEVNEDEIRNRKLTEQISEMIKANPEEAARLVGRWVGEDEY